MFCAGHKYRTYDAAKGIASAIETTLKEYQDNRLLDSPWIGLAGDGSEDKAKKEKHVMVVRYFDQKDTLTRFSEQRARFNALSTKSGGKLPLPAASEGGTPLEHLDRRKSMLRQGPYKVITQYYDLPSVSVLDSRDKRSHDQKAVVEAYKRAFERRGLKKGFNSWKARLSNVNFDGAMMGEAKDGAVRVLIERVDAGEALIRTWAMVRG